MTTELSVQEQQQVRKSSRRGFLKWGVVGGLLVTAGLQVAYRRWRNKASVPTEITIEGPFKEYGYFRPEDLGREDIRKIASDFKLLTLILGEGKYGDKVMISFTFAGKEDADREMRIFLTVYDEDGEVFAGAEDVFRDPRIVAKELDQKGIVRGVRLKYSPTATLAARLNDGIKIFQISKIDITATAIVSSVKK